MNVGRSTIKGAEIEAEFLPWQNTRLSTDIQYVDAVYDSFLIPNAFLGPQGKASSLCGAAPNTKYPGAAYAADCSGQQMIYTPKWTLNFGIDQTIPLGNSGSIVLHADTRWEDSREVSSGYYLFSRVGSSSRSNASVTYRAPESRWSVTAYVRNIENDAVIDFVTPALNQSGLISATLRAPRTYGIRLGANF